MMTCLNNIGASLAGLVAAKACVGTDDSLSSGVAVTSAAIG
jgi:hypothetical protein